MYQFLPSRILQFAILREPCFHGGRAATSVLQSSCACPPNCVLKLNFDGSFVREVRRRGFGGATRDCSGQLL